MILMLSIDVEEWFQADNLKSVIPKTDWNTLSLRVERNTLKLLSILSKHKTKATFFVLGWIAEQLPDLVKEISSQGHEIASHGYDHELVYKQTPEQFKKDLCRSKEILEKCSGQKICGYRAPTFSITSWAIDILKNEGFTYDSSYQPHRIREDFLFEEQSSAKEYTICKFINGLFEIKMAENIFAGFSIPWSGGGYFRLIPYPVFKIGVEKIVKAKGSYCFYIHPWEFDSEQPKTNAPFMKRFKHYHALAKTEGKFKALLNDFTFKPIREILPSG